MSLENLVKTGALKKEPKSDDEFQGLLQSGIARFKDAKNKTLSLESRFDLAYNASHALALAALRWQGYRPNSRYIVFQVLPLTLNLGPEIWRVFAECHKQRNLAEYEGFLDISEQLFKDLLKSTQRLLEKVLELK